MPTPDRFLPTYGMYLPDKTSLQNDLGLDSLAIMMISIVVEEKFGFEFEGNISFETVGELCDYIENKKN